MSLKKEEYILINGIEHFLLHYPKSSGTPVLLYLHGGPGSVESLLAYRLDCAWGNLYTQVHWDQRGAGKTLRRNGRKGLPLSITQMLEDLHGVICHLKQTYYVEQVVLLGHSWGSILGSLYTQQHPESVLYYIGSGQVINIRENEQTAYVQVLEQARQKGNQTHLKALSKMAPYPPENPEELLKLLPKLRKIQQFYDANSVSGGGLFDLLKMMRGSPSFQLGDIISFLQMTKVNRPLLLQMLSFRLTDTPPRYQVPVHYILGAGDPITPAPLTQAYFETIQAPNKTLTLISNAGHNPMYEQPEQFTAALQNIKALHPTSCNG